MRTQKSPMSIAAAGVVLAALVAATTPAFALSGIGAVTMMDGGNLNAISLRMFKVTNNHLDTSYDIFIDRGTYGVGKKQYANHPMINTRGTHVACWTLARSPVDSTFSSSDWHAIFNQQDDAAYFLVSKYVEQSNTAMTMTSIATLLGCTSAYLQGIRKTLDSVANIGSHTQWVTDHYRKAQPAAWNFTVDYDDAAKLWNKTVHKVDPDYRLTVARIDNPVKNIDLISTGKDLSGGDSPGSIAWPQGDWIYFTTVARHRFLYKVNVTTRAIQFVALIDNGWQMTYGGDLVSNTAMELKMSADATKMLLNQTAAVFSLQQLIDNKGIVDLGQWGAGSKGMVALAGCGQTLSPSGNYGGFQVDAGHGFYYINSFNWQNHTTAGSGSADLYQCNRWSLDTTDPHLACDLVYDPYGSGKGLLESVGTGNNTTGQSFSVNSDKWVCMLKGWSPGGRFMGNGSNMILVNFRDSIALNVTRYPRRNDAASVEPQCYRDPNNTYYLACEGTFVVTGPLADVLPQLQADVGASYSIPGIDDATAVPAPSMMPLTPYTGLPTGVRGGFRSRAWASGSAGASVATGGTRGLRVELAGAPGLHEVSVFDVRGAIIAQRRGAGSSEVFAPASGMRPGVYYVKVQAAGPERVVSAVVR